MSCKRWVKMLRFFALERLLDVTQNVYSELSDSANPLHTLAKKLLYQYGHAIINNMRQISHIHSKKQTLVRVSFLLDVTYRNYLIEPIVWLLGLIYELFLRPPANNIPTFWFQLGNDVFGKIKLVSEKNFTLNVKKVDLFLW